MSDLKPEDLFISKNKDAVVGFKKSGDPCRDCMFVYRKIGGETHKNCCEENRVVFFGKSKSDIPRCILGYCFEIKIGV